MSRFDRVPLTIKMALVVLPLAVVGVLVSSLAISSIKGSNPKVVQIVTGDPTVILGESTYYNPPEGYTMPTSCPPPATGTPPNCQAPADYTQPSTSTQPSSGTSGTSTIMPTTCPDGYFGTPPNCQPASGSSQSSSGPPTSNTSATEQCCRAPGEPSQGSTGSGSQPAGSQQGQSGTQYTGPPPSFTKNDSGSCMEKLLGADAYAKFQAGVFNPSPDQIAKVSSCFSARVNYGPPPAGSQGGSSGSGQPGSNSSQAGSNQNVFSSIAIAPPAAFQADSPMVACAKSIVGDRFGSQPSSDQMAQIQAKCFAGATSGQHIGFIDPSGQNRSGPVIAPDERRGERPGPPTLPPEVKACIIKAGMSEATIEAISRGQSPTAAQQQQGEGCFSQYAKDKGYTPPMLTPPDPTQPFDPNSKQNQCADLVAQAHGIRFNQINPGIVAAWSAEDVGKLRSCYGVSPVSSAGNDGSVFTPTSPQVAISNTKLTCIEQAVGSDKLAAVIAGTTTMSETDRRTVYNKCINPTKIAAGADPTLLGVLAAMPPSDLESQFIPIDSQILPAPTAAGTTQTDNGEVVIGGEVNVTAGAALPTKVDVFVKSTAQTFTVSLKKITATTASWTLNVGQSKLALGNHKAYAVATLGDATQTRSPDASFAITTAKATKSNTKLVAGVTGAAVAALLGAWIGWRWHAKKSLWPSFLRWH